MNPTARSGHAGNACEKILCNLRARNIKFDYKMTSKKDEAITISQKVSDKNYDVIVAVGGDGTICEVITGILRDKEKTSKNLGILHIGTSPDFNRHCNIPVCLDDAIETLLKGKTKRIDAGKISFTDLGGQQKIFYFGSSVNIGLGPYIANKANSRYRKHLGDFLGTLASSLISVCNFQGVNLKARIDGKKTDYGSLINLTVGKDPYLASGMRVFNDVLADDGKLFLFSLKKKRLIPLLMNMHKLYHGNFLEYEHADMSYGQTVEVFSTNDIAFVEFDGDMRGQLPAKIEVLPKALNVITA